MSKKHFDRSEHIYHNDAFVELVKDAIRFFNGTPVHSLPPPEKFLGTGVYALYYTGTNKIYQKYSDLNRLSYDFPIYVGKAVPKGWRQSRVSDGQRNQSNELFNRLREHSSNIRSVSGLDLEDFSCRFVIFEKDASDMISSIEAALIKLNLPLWDSSLDGFGNHDPGSGRYEQAKSDWDVIHHGRSWAERLNGEANSKETILLNIEKHLKFLKKS
jgi:hypothetical protein